MSAADVWPLTYADVAAARRILAPHLAPTPLRSHPLLDEAVGHGVRVLVKHENHQPTNAFKARNGLVEYASHETLEKASDKK